MTTLVDVIQFELDGFVCHRGFDPDGNLFVDGPEEDETQIKDYMRKHGAVLQDALFASFVASIPPHGEGDLARKKHAVLELLVAHEEEIKKGMVISAELVEAVLAGMEPIVSIETPRNERTAERASGRSR